MPGDYGIDIVARGNEIKAKKRNKRLKIVTLIVLLLAIFIVAALIFLRWFQNDDRVVIEAVTKTFSNEGIFSEKGGNLKGYYKVTKENNADSYTLNFDIAETAKQTQGIVDIEMEQNAKMKLTGSYGQNGTLFIKGTDLRSFVRRMGGDKVETCIEGGECEEDVEMTAEEQNDEDELEDEGLLTVVQYGQILAGLLEDKWYKLAVDDVIGEGDACIKDAGEKINGDLSRGMISKYYNETSFLEVNRLMDDQSEEVSTYEVKINKDKLTEFLNKIDKTQSIADMNYCFGGKVKKIAVEDLMMRGDWKAELTISKWRHYLEKAKFYGTTEENEKIELEMNITRNAELGIKEPEEAATSEDLRKDIEDGVRGGMRLMYQEMASKECAKNTGSQETLNACKEQVMKQAEKTLTEYKYKFPLKIEL